MDESLNWGPQVNSICKRAHCTIHNLKRYKNILPMQLKKTIVQALIFPIFDYCDVLLNELSSTHSIKLNRAFNHTIKFIFNTQKFDHVTPLLNELKWLRLDFRRKLHTLNLEYKIINQCCPTYLSSYFHELNSKHNFGTCPSGKLMIPPHKSEICSKSFSVLGARYWNDLPNPNIKSLSFPSFKRTVSDILLLKEE